MGKILRSVLSNMINFANKIRDITPITRRNADFIHKTATYKKDVVKGSVIRVAGQLKIQTNNTASTSD
jgi:hypothetical protein